jgi:hypothetical protein
MFAPAQAGIGKRSVSESERSRVVESVIKDLIGKAETLWSTE